MAEYILRPPAASGGDGYILKAPEKPADPTGSFMENVAAGAGKAVVDAGRGLRQIASNVPLLNRLDALNPEKVQAEIDESRKLDAPLMRTGGGVTGNILGNVAMTAAIPGASSVGGATAIGAGLGAVQPVAEGESRLLNTAIGAGSGAAGQVVGRKVAQVIGRKTAESLDDAQRVAAANSARDTTLAAGREAGYVVPPSQAGGGVLSRSLEGLSNKANVAQTASSRNQSVTNDLARKALGLADDAPINEATMRAVRAEAAQAYQAVEGLPRVLWDQEFERGVNALARNKLGGVTSNPADDAINGLMSELRANPAWSGQALVSDIKNLREMAKANLNAAERAGGDVGKSALGKAQMKAAELLEDLAERNLSLNGVPQNLISNFRDARRLIAKTYTVENAILEGGGNVSARKLAAALNRGAPLEGELATAARFANAFPKAAQDTGTMGSVPMFTLTDLVLGAGGGAVNPAFAALAAARPAARNIALSGPVQNALASPSYGPSRMLTLADLVAWNPAVRASIPGASAAGGLTLRDLVQQ